MSLESILASATLEARGYQKRIVEKTVQMFNGEYVNGAGQRQAPYPSVLVESPTGSGKTAIALLVAKLMQAQDPNLVIGWVSMRRNLLAQAESENQAHGINVQGIHFTSMFDKNPANELIAAKDARRKVLICLDECQHDCASSMTHLYNTIRPNYILGMTATPYRTDRVKLSYAGRISDAGINQLVLEGFLSRYDHYTIPKHDVETLTEFYCREPERWGKSLFFFNSLADCFALNSSLKARGILCDVVTGDSDREHQLEAFRNGAIPVLINCMVLTEGFDCPDLKTVFCRPSGRGCTVQMGGRVFRKHKSEPIKQIVQCLQTRWPFLKTVLPHQQYVWQADSWRSLKVNPKMDLVSSNVLRCIANTPIELPKYVTARNKVKKLRFNRE
jgi:superfamily II DNA or RNA helicase